MKIIKRIFFIAAIIFVSQLGLSFSAEADLKCYWNTAGIDEEEDVAVCEDEKGIKYYKDLNDALKRFFYEANKAGFFKEKTYYMSNPEQNKDLAERYAQERLYKEINNAGGKISFEKKDFPELSLSYNDKDKTISIKAVEKDYKYNLINGIDKSDFEVKVSTVIENVINEVKVTTTVVKPGIIEEIKRETKKALNNPKRMLIAGMLIVIMGIFLFLSKSKTLAMLLVFAGLAIATSGGLGMAIPAWIGTMNQAVATVAILLLFIILRYLIKKLNN